jgi:hypothetical protein
MNPHWRNSEWQPSRRELLLGMGSLGLMSLLPGEAEADVIRSGAKPRSSADVCIFINLQGAPSQVDTFDLKVDAYRPAGHVLGGTGAITLNATLFPNLAKSAGDLCLIRSMSSVEEAHERGQFAIRTAHSSNPAFDGETPHIGAVVASEKGGGKFPPFLALNGPTGQGSTFLGGSYGPFITSGCGFSYLEHNFYGKINSQPRFTAKYNLLAALDPSRKSPSDPSIADATAYYDAARNLMYDSAISDVFSCSDSDISRYGNTAIGQSLLVARKAVQARNGVRFINVNHANWDTHQQMFGRGYRLGGVLNNIWDLANELDRGLGALIADLKASGDFARTLIVVVGEFGRTPGPLNGQQGRDHHKAAMSALLAGGGVAGGRVIGATDSVGRTVADFGWKKQRSIYIQDIVSTVYSALGIDWGTRITNTPSGRTYEYAPVINNGNADVPAPVDEAFA